VKLVGHLLHAEEAMPPKKNARPLRDERNSHHNNNSLPPQSQPLDQRVIPGFVLAFDVVQQFAPGGDHDQQAATAVVVFLVGLEMLGQRGDARRQDRDLHFGRTGVIGFGGKVFHDLRFGFGRNRHRGLLDKRVNGAGRDVVQQGPWRCIPCGDACA
jgi:hypothetical protein